MIGLMTAIAWNDWKNRKIPDQFVTAVFCAGILAAAIFDEITILNRISGLLIVSIPLLLLAFFVPGSIGGGDIKLMAAGGFLLGKAWIIQAFVMGIMLAGTYVIVLLIRKKADRKTEIALGPFLCAGIIWSLLKM